MPIHGFCILLGLALLARLPAYGADTLTVQEYYRLILSNHPVIKQARLLPEFAKAEIRIARGLFDPKINIASDEKRFVGTNYWSKNTASLKVPVWWATELSTGFQRNYGDRLSDEDSNPFTGQYYVGASVEVTRLLMDERRSAVRQAVLMRQMNVAEQVKLINKLLLSAAKDYYDWLAAYQKYEYLKTGFEIADFRYKGVVQNVLNGEEAGIDSVEAYVEVLKRLVTVREGKLEFINAGIKVSNYLWNDEGQPLLMDSTLLPSERGTEVQDFTAEEIRVLVLSATQNHPELVKLRLKLEQLAIEKRLQRSNLLPALQVSGKALLLPQQAWALNSLPTMPGPIGQNYQLGFGLNVPIFLRKERGKLLSVNLKVQESTFDLQQSQREIVNSVYQSYNELRAFEGLLGLQKRTVENTLKLQVGENEKFKQGESSLFIVNRRERGTIEEQIKFAELLAKYAKAKVALQWAAGRPLNEVLLSNPAIAR